MEVWIVKARTRAASILVPLAVLLVISSIAVCADDCYEDVVVRNGADEVNGRYRYQRMINGKPGFLCMANPSTLYYITTESAWVLKYDGDQPDDTVWYSNGSSSHTPPTSGWSCDICDLPPCPTPRVSGGEACEGQGEPAVEIELGGTLDLPAGEDPPMLGSLPLAAEFCLGGEIGLDVAVVDTEGEPIPDTQVEVILYAVEFGEDEETREALLSEAVRPGSRNGLCHIGFPSDELAAGIYDLRVRVSPNVAGPEYFRVRLGVCPTSDSSCYEDIVVTGAGESDANGTYEFLGLNAITGFPGWGYYTAAGEGVNRTSVTKHIYFDDVEKHWVLYVIVQSFGRRFMGYVHPSTASTPPETGWQPHPEDGYSSRLPLPTLTGGKPCS